MAITAQDVNKLRTMTGAGMMDCKKALTEAEGDFDAAIDFLRKKGQKVSAARADRETTEGAVFIKINPDATHAVLVALGCETDFVAKNEDFQNLGKALADAAFENNLATAEDIKNFTTSNGQSFSEIITENVGKIGEKLDIVGYANVNAEKVITYLHSNAKLGVLVAFDGVGSADIQEVGDDVAMQIAAMKPIAVDESGVSTDVINREIEVGKELARNEGKPEAMLEKIAQGRLVKFYKESTLLNQEFVKDNSKTIKQVLAGVSPTLKVTSFNRISVG